MSAEVLEKPHSGEHPHHDHDECQRKVSIIVDNAEVFLHPGHYKLDVLKRLSKVAPCDVLEQLVDTELVPVPDDRPIEIKGCEIFASHPKSGGSS